MFSGGIKRDQWHEMGQLSITLGRVLNFCSTL